MKIIHGEPKRVGQRYIRHDRVYRDDGSIAIDNVICASAKDRSDQYNGPYVAACPSCWLGFAHTSQRHAQLIRCDYRIVTNLEAYAETVLAYPSDSEAKYDADLIRQAFPDPDIFCDVYQGDELIYTAPKPDGEYSRLL